MCCFRHNEILEGELKIQITRDIAKKKISFLSAQSGLHMCEVCASAQKEAAIGALTGPGIELGEACGAGHVALVEIDNHIVEVLLIVVEK